MENRSINKLAWIKFKKDKLAFSSLIFIAAMIFFAFFTQVFIPDKTPMANQMHIELATLEPGSKVIFLEIKNEIKKQHISSIYKFFIGRDYPYTRIPIKSYDIKKEDVILYEKLNSSIKETYSGEFRIKTQTFWFGTDKYGRDMLSRIIYGSRISLSVGFIAVFISLIIGIFLGSLAGYYRGVIDNIIMWIINVTWSIPTLLMVIAITLALGKGFWQIFVAVGLTMWVEVARIVRGQVLVIRELEYIEAGRVLGYKSFRIIFKHILPNVIGPVIVISAANFAAAILIEAGLSFLGIGCQPPMPSWGGIIRDHYSYIIMDKAYLALIPGIAMMLLVLSFVLIGNRLRDIFDVKD